LGAQFMNNGEMFMACLVTSTPILMIWCAIDTHKRNKKREQRQEEEEYLWKEAQKAAPVYEIVIDTYHGKEYRSGPIRHYHSGSGSWVIKSTSKERAFK